MLLGAICDTWHDVKSCSWFILLRIFFCYRHIDDSLEDVAKHLNVQCNLCFYIRTLKA